MRRARHPPSQDHRELASVLVDLLSLDEVEQAGNDLRVLLPVAIGEYLRVFTRARNVNGRLYVVSPDTETREYHFLCFFCRESLNTLPWSRGTIPGKMVASFDRHASLCAMRFLSGQIEGVGPNGESPPKPRQPRKPPSRRCSSCEGCGKWVTGVTCEECSGTGRVHTKATP